MPFQSEKQRRYLHANHPEIAKRWERDYAGGGITRIGYDNGGFGAWLKKKLTHRFTEESRDEDIAKWLKGKDVDLTVEEWKSKRKRSLHGWYI